MLFRSDVVFNVFLKKSGLKKYADRVAKLAEAAGAAGTRDYPGGEKEFTLTQLDQVRAIFPDITLGQ